MNQAGKTIFRLRAELAEARREIEKADNRLLHRGDLPLREELSALRAENEALRNSLDLSEWNRTQAVKEWQASEAKVAQQSELIIELGAKLNATKQREEGLEGRVARLAEALKSSPTFRSREYPEHIFVKLDYLLAILRETEGPAALKSEAE